MNQKWKRIILVAVIAAAAVSVYAGFRIHSRFQSLYTAAGQSMYDGLWELYMNINLQPGPLDEASSSQEQQQWAAKVYPGVFLALNGIQTAVTYQPSSFYGEDVSLSQEQTYAIRMFLLKGNGVLEDAAYGDELSQPDIQYLSDFSMVFQFAYSYAEDQLAYSYEGEQYPQYGLTGVYRGMEQFFAQFGRYALGIELPA